MTGVFTPALQELQESGNLLWGPYNFQKYLARIGRSADTARSISVDAYEDLARELRDAETMVLRLGSSSQGRGTDFLLVQGTSVREQFYLDDHDFLTAPIQHIEPVIEHAQLYPFEVLPQLSEYALLSLVIASGALGKALNLETAEIIPASGHFTADFYVRPLTTLSDTFYHRQGQVEVDALFYGMRGGSPVLVVVESKRESGVRSLAKHKLVYPLLALSPKANIPIVPVYVRLKVQSTAPLQIEMQTMECTFPQESPALEELEPVRITRHVVRLQGLPRSPNWQRFRPQDLG